MNLDQLKLAYERKVMELSLRPASEAAFNAIKNLFKSKSKSNLM